MTDQDAARLGSPTRAGSAVPTFLVIGAQKSASTFLQDQLSLHPDIEMPDGEVRAFEEPFYGQGAVAELPGLFEQPAATTVRGIKRPDYLGRAEIPARLHQHLPDARLLVVLREPIARAVSSYYHFVRHGFVPLRPIDAAFSALLAGEWAESHPRSVEVLGFGRYGEQLERYLELYPAEQLMVFDQQAVIGTPQAALEQAFAFVGVDPGFTLPPQARVSNKGVYAPLRLRLLRTKIRTGFRFDEGLTRRFPRRRTPWGWAYNAGVVGLDRLVLSRFDEGRPPTLSAETRRRLEDYYATDRPALRRVLADRPVTVPWL